MPSRMFAACLWLACVAVHATGGDKIISAGQLVSFWSCAAACDEDTPPSSGNPMCLSFGLKNPGGWQKHMQTKIYEDYESGFRRFLLHLPFGSEYGNGGMDLDQPVDNLEAGLGHIANDFYAALAWAEIYMPDAEFIVYLGTAEFDLKAALELDKRYYDHWFRMSGGNWNMVLLDFANTSIVFDYSTRYTSGTRPWDAGDPYFQFVKLMESYKRRQSRLVYLEAVPVNEIVTGTRDLVKYEWQRTMPWFAMESTYLLQYPRWVSHDPPLESPDSIRAMVRQEDLAAWEPYGGAWGWAVDVARAGQTPAINHSNAERFPWTAMTADEIAAAINLLADR